MKAFEEFLQYKTRVPVRGAILLNEAMDSTLLVRGWKKGASWSFPRGKINKDEDDLECAIREMDEETGFDIKAAGLVPKHDEVKYIEITMREQQIRLYVFRNIPMDTAFQPKTRKEISKIQWYKLSELPAFRKKGNGNVVDDAAVATNANKFYMVAPFLVPLKKWVVQQRKMDATRHSNYSHLSVHALPEEPLTEEETGTQTDAAAGESSTPAIDILEGTTRELQRRLKVQPPTQGLQLGVAEAESASRDKGEALMAILQSKGSSAQQPTPATNDQMPHSPFYYIQNSDPMPHASHYHHQDQRMLPNNHQQPPPNFPIVQHAQQQNRHQSYYGPVPGPNHLHQNYYTHAQTYTQNVSHVAQAGQQQRNEPMLFHPQPLPPQVQQSVLTRGMLPTPQLQEAAGMAGHGAPPRPVPINYQLASNVGQGPMMPQRQPQPRMPQAPQMPQMQPQQMPPQAMPSQMPAPQMNNHKMSLLGVLRGGGGTQNGQALQESSAPEGRAQRPEKAPVPPPHGFRQAPAPAPPAQWADAQQAAARPYAQQNMPNVPVMASLHQQLDGAMKPAPADSSRSGQPSTLLDLFKKQGTLSPTSSSDATVRAGKSDNERPVHMSENSTALSDKPQSSVDASVAAAQPDGSPVVMNPELNLPYRAMQILSRPKQAENIPGEKSPQVQSAPAPPPPAHREPRQTMPPFTGPAPVSQAGAAFNAAKQTRTRPIRPIRQPINPPPRHAQYPGAARSPNAVVFPAAGMFNRQETNRPEQQKQALEALFGSHRREPSNPEQKQTLLSLFGKAQPQPSPTTEAKGKMKEASMMDQPRSRVASLGGGEATLPSSSRRGSGTPNSPISTEDRNFLLGYLQNVLTKAP